MKREEQIVFDPFRLDALAERLYRGEEPVVLRPKSPAVLRHLPERPNELVTKDELLDAVWPETSVSDTVLKVCVREIRGALGDNEKPWRFIETAHRRGYRFVGKLSGAAPPTQAHGTGGSARATFEGGLGVAGRDAARDLEEAEACFRAGLEVARRQEAKSFELLAAASLSRLLKRTGKIEEAGDALAQTYGWFAEGSDAPYLREARSLLEETARTSVKAEATN